VFGILTCKESWFEESITDVVEKAFRSGLAGSLPVMVRTGTVIAQEQLLLLDPSASLTIESARQLGTIDSS